MGTALIYLQKDNFQVIYISICLYYLLNYLCCVYFPLEMCTFPPAIAKYVIQKEVRFKAYSISIIERDGID